MSPLREFSNSTLFKINFEHSFENSKLTLNFEISGPILKLYTQASSLQLREGKELWKKNCLEAFFFDEKTSAYTELNFNVSGQYSFLYFKSYRVPDLDLGTFKCLAIEEAFEGDSLKAKAHIQLPQGQRFLLSPTAILMPEKSETLFFALEHGAKPDFHSKKTIENKAFPLLT